MNIDRHNYEEFFILYLDNELTPEQRQRVDQFVHENPDLAPELDLLVQSKLMPDDDIIYHGKEELMKEDGQLSMSLNNYEEWLLLYIDNELSEQDKIKVEKFAEKNSTVKAELELLLQTRLQPENNIIFFDKQSLYRTEEKVRVIPFNWKRIAAAAAILLTVGITAALLYNNKHASTTSNGIAAGGQEKVAPSKTTPVTAPSTKDDSAAPLLAETNSEKENKVAPESIAPVVAKKDKEVKHKAAMEIVEKTAADQKEMAAVKEEKLDNNLPKPTYNPNMKVVEEPAVLASHTPNLREALTNQKEIKPLNTVTSANAQPLYTSNTSSGTTDEPEMESGRKNKLRGFFRKITRTFEKTTNIKATDDDDRLLLGGLAIKL
jgi:hypothetical protein